MKRMMKHVIASILAFSCVACVGCNKNGKESSGAQANPSEVLFADFESWEPNFQACRTSTYFGKISMNTDKEYVHSGERSARIDPVGNGWMYISTYSEHSNHGIIE